MSLRKILSPLLLLAVLTGCAAQGPGRSPAIEVDYLAVEVGELDGVEALTAYCDATEQRLLDRLAAFEVYAGKPTVDGYYRAFDSFVASLTTAYLYPNNISRLATRAEVRSAAEACAQRLARIDSQLRLSRPVFDALNSMDLAGTDETTRYSVEKLLLGFRLAGVDQDEATRSRIRVLNDEIVVLGQEWGRNIADDVRYLELESAEQLAGLPEDFIAAHPPGEDGKIRISTRYPDFFPFMEYAESDQLRRELRTLFVNRGYPDNESVLRKLLEARHELANLVGFDNYAQLVTADKMIGSPERAAEFIDQLSDYTAEAQEREYALLLAKLREDNPDAERVERWQTSYIRSKVSRERFDVDSREVRQYFNYRATKAGILGLVQDLFGLRIEPWQTETWHPDVEAYEMYLEDTLIGRFYLDMHPRDGKYQHAAMFPFVMGVGGRQLPVSALICNFPEGDALMQHTQVVTFLHEFGHLVHYLLGSRHPWVNLTPGDIEWDFIEAPSQMLEEWVWDYGTISAFAKDADGDPLPGDLHERMVAARDFGLGMRTRGQLSLAAVSLRMYDRDPADIDFDELYNAAVEEFTVYPASDDSHQWASFGHLYGYSAIYYTYQWSLAIATDMFSRFRQAGLMDRRIAERYRDAVLRAGSSRPAESLVTDFLGRPVDFQAYADRLSGEAAGR